MRQFRTLAYSENSNALQIRGRFQDFDQIGILICARDGPTHATRQIPPHTFTGELVLFRLAFFLPRRKMDNDLHVRIRLRIAHWDLNPELLF